MMNPARLTQLINLFRNLLTEFNRRETEAKLDPSESIDTDHAYHRIISRTELTLNDLIYLYESKPVLKNEPQPVHRLPENEPPF